MPMRQKRKQKGLRVWNFALLSVEFSGDIMAVKVLTRLTPLLVLMQKSFWW